MRGLFDHLDGYSVTVNEYDILRISYEETKPFILDIHYAKRMPSITYAYGLYRGLSLIGIISYGSPVSPALCKGIAGEKNKDDVLELNRLVLKENKKNQASMLIAASFKLLPKPKIIVSYADSEQDHLGIVYQATNFLYTGLSDKRTEWRMKGSNLHSKTVCDIYSLEERMNNPDKFINIERPRKHRYIYLLGGKIWKKNMSKQLAYKTMDYPKQRKEK